EALPLHAMDQRDERAAAAVADGVAERDAAARRIDTLQADPDLPARGEHHRRERLVDLPPTDVLGPDARALQRERRRRPGAHADEPRIDPDAGQAPHADEGPEPELRGLLTRHEQDRRRAVAHAR